MKLLAAQSAALIESYVELVACQTRSIDIQAGWIVHVARRVDDSLECAVEHDHGPDEIVWALGRNVCSPKWFVQEQSDLRLHCANGRDSGWVSLLALDA